MTANRSRRGIAALVLALAFVPFTGCGSSAPGGGPPPAETRRVLEDVAYGRIVDLYAWRRVDPDVADRAHPGSREPVLVERDVLVDPAIVNEDPISNPKARFRFLPYDPSVGHRELLVLWDDRLESSEFEAARLATRGVVTVAPHAAFQPGPPRPAPVVPRDACIRLTFDRPLGLDGAFFRATPGAVQLLELAADPEQVEPRLAYRRVPARVLVKEGGKVLLLDPEVSGDETRSWPGNPRGLPAPTDTVTANVRIALATSGLHAKTFRVRKDRIPTLNGRGMKGESIVLRDLRAAESAGGGTSYLSDPEPAQLVARKEMGIVAVDLAERELTLNKRFADVVVRGRLPFVDGPLRRSDGRPLGAARVPQVRPFVSGDVVWQDVLSPNGERVRIKAEVLRNLDIPAVEDDPRLGIGGGGTLARVQVSTVQAFDSRGARVTFAASSEPLGQDCVCVVHYHDSVPLQGGEIDAGDAGRLAEFLGLDPAPPRVDPRTRVRLAPNERVDPMVATLLRFSRPMELASVRADDNVVLASTVAPRAELVAHAKVGGLGVVPAGIADEQRDATAVRVVPPLGLFHQKGATERYFLHLRGGAAGPRARGGERLDLGMPEGKEALTFDFTLDGDAEDNLVAWVLRRMSSADEDGTSEERSSVDAFGQYQVRGGRLWAWPADRFSRVVDRVSIGGIRRDLAGECRNTAGAKVAPCAPLTSPMLMYQTPTMFVAGNGGIAEPLVALGSRNQITYREDDLGLAYRNEYEMEIDVEQLHWSPFVGRTPELVTFDLFDRVSIRLGTAEKRPDLRPIVAAGCCGWDVATFQSGLTPSFAGNYLDGTSPVQVVADQPYVINPSRAFAAGTTTLVPYPKFAKTYTWRDRRLTRWDAGTKTARGLGGSQRPADPTAPDRTKDITSPHLPETEPDDDGLNSKQPGDYLGGRAQDHGPFALPLLVDILVDPDEPENGAVRTGNLFQIALLGPATGATGGYYNRGWPWFRVHSTGGIDRQQNRNLVVPGTERIARGGWLDNAILGRFQAPPGDGHLFWGQVDFVRKHSVVTWGYIDTLVPGRNDVTGPEGSQRMPDGFPNLGAISTELRAAEFAVVLHPAPAELPLGTNVAVEYRGADVFQGAERIWKAADDEEHDKRGNLLNPHYACEQFRYVSSGRLTATGLTRWVRDPEDLRDQATGLAPRYLSWRMTLTSNTGVTPARLPWVDAFAVVYRVR